MGVKGSWNDRAEANLSLGNIEEKPRRRAEMAAKLAPTCSISLNTDKLTRIWVDDLNADVWNLNTFHRITPDETKIKCKNKMN